jgi:pyruvate/oxaloacetate carboxyltransferase
MNDPRNHLEAHSKRSNSRVKACSGHYFPYTTNCRCTQQEMWVDLAKQIEDMSADSITIGTWPGFSILTLPLGW